MHGVEARPPPTTAVFTMRAGVNNRLNGVVVAVMELVLFAIPFRCVCICSLAHLHATHVLPLARHLAQHRGSAAISSCSLPCRP